MGEDFRMKLGWNVGRSDPSGRPGAGPEEQPAGKAGGLED